MNEQAFVEKREEDWQRLTKLCDRAGAGATRLSADEVREFLAIYRRTSTDLAVARTQSTNVVLIDFLNDLVARAYGVLYRAPRVRAWEAVQLGIALSAQTFRRNRNFIYVSAAIFFGSAFFAYGIMSLVPETRQVLVSPQMESTFEQWKSGQFVAGTASDSFRMWGFYVQNNPRTAIIAGAVGAGTFGVMSIQMLFENGALIGALAHEVAQVGKLGFLLSSITPHGVPELSGAIVGGAAGLKFGWALIHPGRVARGRALQEVGRDAIVLLATSVVLMFIAAPIEGFFSFNPAVPSFVKVIVTLVSLVAWALFWSRYARTPEENGEVPSPRSATG